MQLKKQQVTYKKYPRKKVLYGWLQKHSKVIEERRLKKLEGSLVQVRRLNAEIQKQTRQEKYYSKKCKIIEKNKKLGKTRELFQEIREITCKPKINTGVLKSKMDKDEIEKTE